jgi:putative hydrolase of the HAD superfamily
MFISGSGEVGTVAVENRSRAVAESLQALGVPYRRDGETAVRVLEETVAAHHQRLRETGIEYPEVDIVEVWREVLYQLAQRGEVPQQGVAELDYGQLAVHYEVRVNPVWPMPGLGECLDQLRQTGLLMGIVSNAQFFTPELFPALLGHSPEEVGIDPHLQYYSYRYHHAKPGGFLFGRAERDLAGRGIARDRVLFIGNDMLNDIQTAARVGFRTALFAGDARSLRLRTDDPRTVGVEPDLVLTELGQLILCLPCQTARDA